MTHDETTSYVLYRTPHSQHFTRLVQRGEPRTFHALEQMPEGGGYAIVPFEPSADCPLVWIEPDEATTHAVPAAPMGLPSHHESDEAAQRAAYSRAFATAHSRLTDGTLRKVVLSRRLVVTLHEHEADLDAQRLFLRACHYRPGSFVALWHTPHTGTWLTATPEVLLDRRHHVWSTMALAGTLPWQEGVTPVWNAKNREEQQVVARFIDEQLRPVCDTLTASPVYTLHTGNLQHLCTDFRFTLPDHTTVGEVLARLHPTPAVCGMPRQEALRTISQAEATPRRYYAGFSGPLHLLGETHLYVSLRCMAFSPRQATLYAGGGLMPESQEAEEWDETQRKLTTMLQLL